MKISVIGLGKLGLPIAEVLHKNKYKVIGIDKRISKTMNFNNLGVLSFVVVPTPSLKNNKFTSEYVEEVLEKIKIKHTVVIVSTLMPKETDRLQKKYPNLTLIYNPTFVALGTVAHDFTHPDFILIGTHDLNAIKKLKHIYKKICLTKPQFAILTPLEAEIAKLSLNCYITTKITFANQIGNLCYRLGIKSDRICQSVGMDSRIGGKYFKAGLGYGGPCFPRDNLALSSFMKENGIYPELFETVHELNEKQTDEIVNRILEHQPLSVGFPGLGYKKGSNFREQSPLLKIWDKLKKQGIKVKVSHNCDVNLNWGGIR